MEKNVEEPLIYTSKGNLPIASLQYRHEWTENENEIIFAEEYLLDGEIVKRSVHAKLKKPLTFETQQATFG